MINVIGSFFDTSGYASHTRSLANALAKVTDVKLTTNLPAGWERLVNDTELKMVKNVEDYKTNLIITNPLFWSMNAYAATNIAFLIWEGDKVPQWILQECLNERIHHILVVSEHTKQAVENSYSGMLKEDRDRISNKISLAPHGVNTEDFYPTETKRDKFTFFANKGLRNLEDRGGIQYLVKAYLEEFDGSDTELIIKINPAYGIPNLAELFPKSVGRLDVKFNIENLDKKELNKLYNNSDVFVSPTRAEAFNLPCLEALSCGKPVITTNFGGQTDFCNGDTGWIIGGELKEVEHELEYEGVKWLTPSIDELKKAMRTASKNQNDYSYDCIQTAKEYSWDKTAKIINKLTNPNAYIL